MGTAGTDDMAVDAAETPVEPEEPDPLVEALEKADEVAVLAPEAAIDAYLRVLQTADREDEVATRTKEEAIYRLARAYARLERFGDVMALLQTANSFFAVIAKAKTAKIVRTLLDIVAEVPGERSLELQVELCTQVIAWCTAEKRTFLRQRVESRYVQLLFEQKKYQDALSLLTRLLRELKKLDDKQLLVEAHLVEARVHHALRNVPKAKAALTAARTAGNAIYVVPMLQAELDQMSGVLHTEEGDYVTAHSYFLEAYEGVDSLGDAQKPAAVNCLKYQMLCLVLGDKADDVTSILSGKAGVKHAGPELEAMRTVAKAASNRSLDAFDKALEKHATELRGDVLIEHHLGLLYDKLLEANLSKIVEPFSCVEIARVAELIDLPLPRVERKLSQMILDKKLSGILDQGRGHLILYPVAESDNTYENGLGVISNMGDVVNSLFRRAEALAV